VNASREERRAQVPGRSGDASRGQAVEILRGVCELLEREGEKPTGRGRTACAEVDESRRDLDQSLEVAAERAGRPAPDRFPLLVRLVEAAGAEGLEPAREAGRVGSGEGAQLLGRAARMRSISGAST